MTPQKLVLLLALCITQVATAADAPSRDSSKDSSALLQVQLTSQQRQLEAAESELVQLRAEQTRIDEGLRKLEATSVDPAQLRRALEDFKKDFEALQASVENSNTAALPPLYDRMEKSLRRLETGNGWTSELPQWPHFPNPQAPKPVLDSLYSLGANSSLANWELFSPLQGLHQPRSSQGTAQYTDITNAVKAAVGIVVALSEEEVVRAFQQDQVKMTAAWMDLDKKVKAAIASREALVEEARTRINALSTELETRQIRKNEVDTRLNWAVPSMIFSLSLLFLLTRFFRPEIQAIIFQQRTLVEMVGMAFLLLTIIILGTDGKIDTSVLGTLLGTVGGYIFGQQVQSRRGSGTEAPKPYPEATLQAEAPRQPPAGAGAMTLPMAAAPVSAPPPQAAANLQQAAQQGELPAAPAKGGSVPPA